MHNPFCNYKYDILSLCWTLYYVRAEMIQAVFVFLGFLQCVFRPHIQWKISVFELPEKYVL